MLQRVLVGAILLSLWTGIAQAHEDPHTTVSRLTHRIQEHPSDPDLYLQRGELHRLAGNWLAAEADYTAARANGADPSRVTVCLAALELDRGNPTGVLAILQPFPKGGTPALFLQGRALRQLGRFQEAAAALEQAVASSPRPRPEDYLELSETVLGRGDAFIAAALDVLDAGLRRLGPTTALILAAAELEVRRGEHASALLRMRAAPAPLQESPAWITRQGEILMQAGRELEAQAEFTEALLLLRALPAHRRSVPANVSLEGKLRGYLSAPTRVGGLPPESRPSGEPR